MIDRYIYIHISRPFLMFELEVNQPKTENRICVITVIMYDYKTLKTLKTDR